ncbi:MAG TPA: SIMPL domain-containing protein [Firmicutes bacterium]|nr:SIMPL domain-containing protein [Bacillota bacterium]
MKRSLTGWILCTALLVLMYGMTAQAADYYVSQTLTTVGSGFVVLPADIAVVSVAIETSAAESGAAHQENLRITEQIMAALKEEKIPGLQFNMRQVMFWENTSLSTREKSYKASAALDIQTNDLAGVGHIIDIAEKMGATSVQNVRFDISDIDAAAQEALRLAVADGMRKAELMASAAGMRIAIIRELRDNNAVRVYNPSQPTTAAAAETALPALAAPVYRGQVLVQTEVTLIFEVVLDRTKSSEN